MRIVADENFPFPSVRAMRQMGIDILSIQQSFPGFSDTEVLRVAVREKRILLTFDRDFGDRIFHKGEPPPPGVVLLRFRPVSPLEPSEILPSILEETTLEGNFTVITRRDVRQRPLPAN
jgi:predicted nuclease of predicted toxin-antitoxin system